MVHSRAVVFVSRYCEQWGDERGRYLSALSSALLALPVGSVRRADRLMVEGGGGQAYVEEGLDALRVLGGLRWGSAMVDYGMDWQGM